MTVWTFAAAAMIGAYLLFLIRLAIRAGEKP